ncbi:MAG: type II and III secretion system protein [Bryobacteraceae bacterium]|nr:type II and III secretion system protein [Bryobacteraceae bacterium]
MAVVVYGVWTLALQAQEPSAKSMAKQARKAEKQGDAVKAYLLYSQAAAADPKRRDYWARSQALRTRALRQSSAIPAAIAQVTPPDASAVSRKEAEPPVTLPVVTQDEVTEARQPLPPIELSPRPGVRDLDLRGDAKSLFDQVLKAYGLDMVFDADYTPGSPIRFRMSGADFVTAIRALQAATASFIIPLSPKLCMVYKDTQQKRREAEPMVAVAVSLPNTVSVQEAQELGRAVQQVMEMRRVAIDNSQRLVIMRDAVSKVRAAQLLLQQLLTLRSQVMIEVEIMDVQQRGESSYGASLPTSTGLAFLGPDRPRVFQILPGIPSGFTRFLSFGGGLTTLGLAITDARLFANFTKSSSQSLFKASIRSVDGQAATLHVGDKYPLITSQYIGQTGSSALATPPTFNFEDLGLTLKVTPRIHSGGEVSIQVEAEFKILGSGSYNGIPVIANRKFASVVRLKDGEYGILAGILSSSEARSISGIPGIGHIPVLRSILSQNTRSNEDGQALVVIKPHILDAPPDMPGAAVYTGTETRWDTFTVRR